MLRRVPTSLAGIVLIEPQVWSDARGFFLETYHAEKYRQLGITGPFVQDNHSRSTARTLRGLHLQNPRPQGKLLRVIEGEIFDVAVDVRRGSPQFGTWVGISLSAGSFRQCYIPPGFAHGFFVVSDVAQVEYKCTTFYDGAAEIGIAWNDPEIGIRWPAGEPILSPKDARLPRLADVLDRLPTIDECEAQQPLVSGAPAPSQERT